MGARWLLLTAAPLAPPTRFLLDLSQGALPRPPRLVGLNGNWVGRAQGPASPVTLALSLVPPSLE
jgi:hypothetical protein